MAVEILMRSTFHPLRSAYETIRTSSQGHATAGDDTMALVLDHGF